MSDALPACLVCGARDSEVWAEARDVEYFSVPETFTYRRCARCENLFIDPVPEDRLATIYPSNYYSFEGGIRSPIQRVKSMLDRRVFRKLLRDIPGEELAALDVGGGTGWMLDQLRAVEPRIAFTQVVDIDPGAAERAREKGHAYFCGPIQQFSTDRTFDVVLLINLIEHVRDPVGVLTSIRERLAPGGRVLVKTPNYDSLDARLFRHRSWGGLHCPRHWVLFTLETFTRAATDAGLAVVRSGHTQGAPFWTVSVLAGLQARGLVRLSAERPTTSHPLAGPLAAGFAALDFMRLPFARTSQMFFELGHPG